MLRKLSSTLLATLFSLKACGHSTWCPQCLTKICTHLHILCATNYEMFRYFVIAISLRYCEFGNLYDFSVGMEPLPKSGVEPPWFLPSVSTDVVPNG